MPECCVCGITVDGSLFKFIHLRSDITCIIWNLNIMLSQESDYKKQTVVTMVTICITCQLTLWFKKKKPYLLFVLYIEYIFCLTLTNYLAFCMTRWPMNINIYVTVILCGSLLYNDHVNVAWKCFAFGACYDYKGYILSLRNSVKLLNSLTTMSCC